MLSKEHRLRNDKDIKTLFAKGKGVFGFNVNIKYRPNGLQISRFAVVVGTKVSKKAVVRNRLKRQIRAIVFKHLKNFRPGFDVVFMPKKEAIGGKSLKFEEEVLRNLKQKTRILKASYY
ncbi:ribonuclease P protein component [Candidatus Uhrbacteria bacterium]|nr:ribonuclease P protein component [Candidatus Uhrbacteria bacterium]